MKKLIISFVIMCACVVASAKINPATQFAVAPFYIGLSGGYGSTNWSSLDALDLSTETSVPTTVDNDTGFVWGALIGYELNRFFALELQYRDYPTAKINLSNGSDYWPLLAYKTETYTVNFLAKFMIPLGDSKFRAFADAGVAYVHRKDTDLEIDPDNFGAQATRLADKSHIGPTFGLGVNYLITPKWLAELAFEYNTGYGKAQEETLKAFVPFVYSIVLNIDYRFDF